MIIHKILDHDLHRPKKGLDASPFMIEVPSRPEFFPAIVSTPRSKKLGKNFVTSPHRTKEGMARVGVFEYDPDRIDEVISEMFEYAYCLSQEKKWKNVFNSPKVAFNYIKKSSGLDNQPHVCLIPDGWNQKRIEKWLGKKEIKEHRVPVDPVLLERDKEKSEKPSIRTRFIYRDVCRLVHCSILFPVFLSRPDLVGMYTQFLGGRSAVILHNIHLGIAFCPPKGEN